MDSEYKKTEMKTESRKQKADRAMLRDGVCTETAPFGFQLSAFSSCGRRPAFTLIERVPSRRLGRLLIDGSSIPANFPFRAGSLIHVPHRATGASGGVTKSPEGNRTVRADEWHAPEALSGNGQTTDCMTPKTAGVAGLGASPGGEANAQAVGRRTTASIVKGATADIAGRAVVIREGEPVLDGRSPLPPGKQMGTSTRGTDGVKGGGMRGRASRAKSGENLSGPAATPVRSGISRAGENQPEAGQGVGDGHSTVTDLRGSKTCGQGRAISLNGLLPEEGPA
jgi:hypothetical protein